MKKSEEFVKFHIKLLGETKVSYIIAFGMESMSIPKKCSYHFSDSIYILSEICRRKHIPYGPGQIYNINEIEDKMNKLNQLNQMKSKNIKEVEKETVKKEKECIVLDVVKIDRKKEKEEVLESHIPVKDDPRLPTKILYYHSRGEKSNITACAIVQNSLSSPNSVVTFGFSKCKKGDQFSKKYGREQAFLRADQDPRVILVFKDFKPSQFVTTAKKLVNEINHVTDWGKSLVSPLLISTSTEYIAF